MWLADAPRMLEAIGRADDDALALLSESPEWQALTAMVGSMMKRRPSDDSDSDDDDDDDELVDDATATAGARGGGAAAGESSGGREAAWRPSRRASEGAILNEEQQKKKAELTKKKGQVLQEILDTERCADPPARSRYCACPFHAPPAESASALSRHCSLSRSSVGGVSLSRGLRSAVRVRRCASPRPIVRARVQQLCFQHHGPRRVCRRAAARRVVHARGLDYRDGQGREDFLEYRGHRAHQRSARAAPSPLPALAPDLRAEASARASIGRATPPLSPSGRRSPFLPPSSL